MVIESASLNIKFAESQKPENGLLYLVVEVT